jgi:hypothetical protein
MANELFRVDSGYGFGSSNGNITTTDTLTYDYLVAEYLKN